MERNEVGEAENPEEESVVSEENSEVVSHDTHAMFREDEALVVDVPLMKPVVLTEEQEKLQRKKEK